MRASQIRIRSVLALVALLLAMAHGANSDEALVKPDTLVDLAFRHVVLDMNDSIAEVTEMLILRNRSTSEYLGKPEGGGIEVELPKGYVNLAPGGPADNWQLSDSTGVLRYLAPLPSGLTRLVLSYELIPADGMVEFEQDVVRTTRKYVFVTSNPKVSLASSVLKEQESVTSGDTEVRGLSGSDLSPGTTVRVSAQLAASVREPSSGVSLVVTISLIAVSVLIYVTARMARTACTDDVRLVQLEERKELIAKSIEGLAGARKRAYEERLAATERLIELIVDIRTRGTNST